MARPATVEDVHEFAAGMPGAARWPDSPNAIYQVSRRSFVFFRNPRPDAFDPDTGDRYDDVIVFWVESEEDKRVLVDDPSTPFFTTPALRRTPVGAVARRPGRRAGP